jgi:hypothetical protein
VSPLDDVNGARRNLLARIGLPVGCRVSGAGGRSGSAAPSLSTHNAPLAIRGAFGQTWFVRPLGQENAGIRRPGLVWEEIFRKASVPIVTTAMYRPCGLVMTSRVGLITGQNARAAIEAALTRISPPECRRQHWPNLKDFTGDRGSYRRGGRRLIAMSAVAAIGRKCRLRLQMTNSRPSLLTSPGREITCGIVRRSPFPSIRRSCR